MNNTFYVTNPDFLKTDIYQDFMMNHPGKGNLKIRAYAASEALPVSGLRIIISTEVGGDKIVFFEGQTDSSGMIPTINLPTPALDFSNLEVHKTISYQIKAISQNSTSQEFTVKMYDGICVVQNINFVPGGQDGN